MFKLDSGDALLAAFRPKDQAAIQLPPQLGFPLFVRDYLAWSHPAGGRVYVLFAVPRGVPTGIVFQTNDAAGAAVPGMCEWCHCTSLGSRVALLTARVSSRRRAGVYVCADLSCKQKLEEDADRSGRSALPAMERLLERMGRFATEALHIDVSGAGRGPVPPPSR